MPQTKQKKINIISFLSLLVGSLFCCPGAAAQENTEYFVVQAEQRETRDVQGSLFVSGELEVESLDLFLENARRDTVFWRDTFIVRESEKLENGMQQIDFEFLASHVPNGNYILSIGAINSTEERVGVGSVPIELSRQRESRPLGEIRDATLRATSRSDMEVEFVYTPPKNQNAYISASFFEQDLRGVRYEQYTSTPFAVKTGELTNLSFEFQQPWKAESYAVVIQVLDRQGRALSGEKMLRWVQEGDFAEIETISPESGRVLDWERLFPLVVQGIAPAGSDLTLEVRSRSEDGEGKVSQKIYNQPLNINEDFSFRNEVAVESPNTTEIFDIQVRILTKKTQKELDKKQYSWKILPPTPTAQVVGTLVPGGEGGGLSAKLRILGLLVAGGLFAFLLGRKKKHFLVVGITTLLVSTGIAQSSEYKAWLMLPSASYEVSASNPNINVYGTIEHVLWKTSPLSSEGANLESVSGVLRSPLPEQTEIPFTIDPQNVQFFRALPSDDWSSFRFEKSIQAEQPLSGTYDLELTFVFTLQSRKEVKLTQPGFVTFTADPQSEGCQYGDRNCSIQNACNPVFQQKILSGEGGWIFSGVANQPNQRWTFQEGRRVTGACAWGCLDGYERGTGTFNCRPKPEWQIGQWAECSASCGGGAQKRAVWCLGTDGRRADDSVCEALAPRPKSTQPCNPQPCCFDAGYVFEEVTKNLPFGIEESKTTICEAQALTSQCPETFVEEARCCSGFKKWQATEVVSCNPFNGGDCFFCPDSIGEGSECSGWQATCL